MLLSFALTNFRSFAARAVLDMQKRGFQRNLPKGEGWMEVTERLAGLYGPNASGKTTVVGALGALSNAVRHSITTPGVGSFLRTPHMFHVKRPTEFEVEYVAQERRYLWTLVLDDLGVSEERLETVAGTGHWRMLFHRTGDAVRFGKEIGIPRAGQEIIGQFLRPWSLVLSAWEMVKEKGPHEGAVRWWWEKLQIFGSPGNPRLPGERDGQLLTMLSNSEWTGMSEAVLRAADVGLTGVEIREEEILPQLKEILEQSGVMGAEEGQRTKGMFSGEETAEMMKMLDFTHEGNGRSFTLREGDESEGTRTWLNLAMQGVKALVEGNVLVVDEVDASLHPTLVRFFLSLFERESTNPDGAQLIYTAHDVASLGNAVGERLPVSAVWLVDKIEAESELISLDEFSIRGSNNVEKKYLEGEFGALPSMGTDIDRAIEEIRYARKKKKG
ncbi:MULTISPECIES: ATP-binding protein [unclassified Corynebacterium]|uniref:AAA family ATPase n=1 Tax=unclassified Corynebacterium TaxID=2624378 RepID=UPI0029CA8C70|nr:MULTISPECIES: ATP-binding protein [unclassified Corynebacterium]WPF66201.1 ATP-binding protein [Corynebacterium sp. 22KM0430]WPF68692.1 ATP-binding protein [Corynebacterium sp. 21KM1197]